MIASITDRESQYTFSDAIQIDSDWSWLCALFLLAVSVSIPVPVPIFLSRLLCAISFAGLFGSFLLFFLLAIGGLGFRNERRTQVAAQENSIRLGAALKAEIELQAIVYRTEDTM